MLARCGGSGIGLACGLGEYLMRVLLCLMLLLPGASFADTIYATSTITAVTVYPNGAQITREVQFTGGAGPHEVLVTDLPGGVDPRLIRIATPDGISLGAFSVRTDRLPPRPVQMPAEQTAAKAAVEALQIKEHAALAVIAGVTARVEAAEAQIGFLRSVDANTAERTVEGLKSIGQMIAGEVLLARQVALVAQADLPAAQMALTAVQDELANAQAAYDALPQRDAEYVALSVMVDQQTAGDAKLTVTHYVADATWLPVYDINLQRKIPKLTIERGVLVNQNSGEDWGKVALTLSTVAVSERSWPADVYPELRHIIAQAELDRLADLNSGDEGGGLVFPVSEPEVTSSGSFARPDFAGDVVVYHYPSAVSVASGVDALRLALDVIEATPTIEARAVPRSDATAYLMARFSNDSGEILLPGPAYLMRDGTLVGNVDFAKVAPGDKAELAFGPIEGLRLRRDMPLTMGGDTGIISTTNQVEEKAVMVVENLTDEVWPVRLLDQVPYSEQEDLEITYNADPAPTEVDVEGKRGVLAWVFVVAPGETKAVKLDHLIQWPEGFVLR